MQVFVTGATGWVGMAVVDELIAHGHRVLGLSRSVEKGAALEAKGAKAVRGSFDDLDVLAAAARDADAVIHLGFDHNFSRYVENSAQDRRVIAALGSALLATDKRLLVTSTLSSLPHTGQAVTEDALPASAASYPRRSEEAARELAERGVHAATVRFPTSVHAVGETHGFVPILIDIAREKGVSAYIGDGANRWPAVHVTDAARLYRLALETDKPQPAYHAVGDDGIPFRDIAEAIGPKLGLPVASREASHFGWFADFAGEDLPAASEVTRAILGWRPDGPGLLADIASPDYYSGTTSRTP